jgi:hypothetical protein
MRLAVRCSVHICLGASPSAEDSFLRFLPSSPHAKQSSSIIFLLPAPISHLLVLAAAVLLLLLLLVDCFCS